MELKLKHIHDDDQDWAIRLCMRVGDIEFVAPGSIQKRCEECGVMIWYDPNQRLPLVPGVTFVGEVSLCFPCGALHMAHDEAKVKWAGPDGGVIDIG